MTRALDAAAEAVAERFSDIFTSLERSQGVHLSVARAVAPVAVAAYLDALDPKQVWALMPPHDETEGHRVRAVLAAIRPAVPQEGH